MRPKLLETIRRFPWRLFLQPALAVAVALALTAPVRAASHASQRYSRPGPLYEIPPHLVYGASSAFGSRSDWAQNPSREDPRRMQRQYQEWQSLPPEQKDAMRRRMEELNRMPPQDRDRYQQRYRQWQQLPPEDRRRIENDLQRWDRLSPQERDSIQRRFKP